MRDGVDTMILSGVLMVALVWLLFTSMETPVRTTGYVSAEEPEINMVGFTDCMYANGATLYVSIDGGKSEEQKAIFGEHFESLKYVVCEDACYRQEVTNFPTWWIGGKKYEGVMSLKELSELSGCPLY